MRTALLVLLLSGLLLTASHAAAQRIGAAGPQAGSQTLDASIVAALRPTPSGVRCAELRSPVREILAHHQSILQDPTCRRFMFQSLSN